MKNFIKRLLRPKVRRVIITFSQSPDGKNMTTLKIDKSIPVSALLTALDKIKWDVQTRLTVKARAAGLNLHHPKTADFIKRQKLGDVL